MASKYCPHCGTIISTSGIPNFCWNGCGSLAEQPVFPDHSQWPPGGYYELCEIAKKEYEERQAKKAVEPLDLGNGRLQMRLFNPEALACV